VSAFECDLERVLADQGHVFDPQLIGVKTLHPVEPSGGTSFAPALCARTRPSQLFARVAGVSPAFPRDFHHLAFAVDVNVGRKRVRVLQLGA
jgi:hypothetical protein